MKQFSIVISVYNEEKTINKTILELKKYLETKFPDQYEIIAVNDGSTDKSGEILQNIASIKIITHNRNKGYGASLKTGAKNSRYDWLLFFDGDGQHKTEYIENLIKTDGNYEMVVGERQGKKGPLARQPGKKLIGLLANYLVSRKIPDINSGLRLIKKERFYEFLHLLPDGFSLSTTITLAFFKNGLEVKYVPITINQRDKETKSAVKPVRDGFGTILLMLRLIMLFNPLRIFMPVSLFLLSFGIVFGVYGVVKFHSFPVSGAVIIVAGLLLFFNGLLADQISTVARNREK